jgi:hypothetical protein
VKNGDQEITFNSVRTAIFAFGRMMVAPEFEGCQPKIVRDFGNDDEGNSASVSGSGSEEGKGEDSIAKCNASKKTAMEDAENEEVQAAGGAHSGLETPEHDQKSDDSATVDQSSSGSSTAPDENQAQYHKAHPDINNAHQASISWLEAENNEGGRA